MNDLTPRQMLRNRMIDLLASVQSEIRDYPPPVPACDQQFNQLLKLRAWLPQELQRLDDQSDEGFVTERFVNTSPCREALSRWLPGSSD